MRDARLERYPRCHNAAGGEDMGMPSVRGDLAHFRARISQVCSIPSK